MKSRGGTEPRSKKGSKGGGLDRQDAREKGVTSKKRGGGGENQEVEKKVKFKRGEKFDQKTFCKNATIPKTRNARRGTWSKKEGIEIKRPNVRIARKKKAGKETQGTDRVFV